MIQSFMSNSKDASHTSLFLHQDIFVHVYSAACISLYVEREVSVSRCKMTSRVKHGSEADQVNRNILLPSEVAKSKRVVSLLRERSQNAGILDLQGEVGYCSSQSCKV